MKRMVIMMGIPGSGKSTFYQRYLRQDFVRVNLDTLKTRHREKLLSLLNEEQTKILEKYESNEEELYCLAQEDAFTEGIRYAVQFLVEAMG